MVGLFSSKTDFNFIINDSRNSATSSANDSVVVETGVVAAVDVDVVVVVVVVVVVLVVVVVVVVVLVVAACVFFWLPVPV